MDYLGPILGGLAALGGAVALVVLIVTGSGCPAHQHAVIVTWVPVTVATKYEPIVTMVPITECEPNR